MPVMNCATTGLEIFTPTTDAPWNRERVMHLFRRAGYGARPGEIELALLEGPEATVDRLLDEANDRPHRPRPEWADWDYDALTEAGLDAFDTYLSWGQGWMLEVLNHGVREKLQLFWENHFVAKYESYSCPSYYYQYTDLLSRNAFGNLKEMVVGVTRSPAMLFFLNGFQNTRQDPNENFARELFELFTLGENNGYTQEDIVQASRALTGFNGWTSYCGPVEWASWGFDPGPKTVFEQTGQYDYIGLIDLLFQERGALIARYISEKLYRFYVNRTIDEVVVQGMADTMLAGEFEILPVLKQLFKSAHFFDEAHRAALIKDPMELLTTWMREGEFGSFASRPDWAYWSITEAGQQLSQQPDVAGWPGDRAWIDSNRLTLRWKIMDTFTWLMYSEQRNTYVDFAKQLTDNSDSPEVIVRAFMDYFVPGGSISDEAYQLATDAFKGEVPENYYTNGTWSLDYPSAPWQGVLLMRHIGRMPEFQLC